VRAELKARIAAERAVDLIYDRAGKLEDLLAGGVKLDELPTDLGLAAVTGTLDATGHTPGGEAAPIPGDAALRDAVVHAAFAARVGDPPKLEQVRGAAGSSQGYYALVVEEITPPKPRPYDDVAGAVAGDWTRDAVRHEREQVAAGILAAVKGGKTLAEAAAAAGLTARRLPATGRESAADGVPPALLQPLFALKPGEPTMVETPEGFVVAVLADVQSPDPSTDPVGYGRIREALARSIGNDTQLAFAQALRDRSQPRINTRLVDSLAQAPE
jgi:peptidyl-prolyl cis-trans isomerase D